MPKVMIDGMEMPKSCGWCRFYTEDESEISYCIAKSSERWIIPFREERDLAENRPSWCPLKPVKE